MSELAPIPRLNSPAVTMVNAGLLVSMRMPKRRSLMGTMLSRPGSTSFDGSRRLPTCDGRRSDSTGADAEPLQPTDPRTAARRDCAKSICAVGTGNPAGYGQLRPGSAQAGGCPETVPESGDETAGDRSGSADEAFRISSGEDYAASYDRVASGDRKADGLGVDPVLLVQNAGGERVYRVVVQDGNGSLEENGA